MAAPIYLDHHATTPVDRRVLDRMLPYFSEMFGNPASATHAWGWKAKDAVEGARGDVARLTAPAAKDAGGVARRDVAALIGASAKEIYFTSGAPESNNLAMQGAWHARDRARSRVVVSAIEHKSVLDCAQLLQADGAEVVVAPVTREGVADLNALRPLVDSRTAMVCVMAANNEIGTVQPLAEIGEMTMAAGALFIVDAAQAAGKVPIDVGSTPVDLLSLTGHKMYG